MYLYFSLLGIVFKICSVHEKIVLWNILLLPLHKFNMNAFEFRHLVFVACEDGSVSVLTTTNGCRQWPPMVLDSRISTLQCGSQYVAAITSHAFLYVWYVLCL